MSKKSDIRKEDPRKKRQDRREVLKQSGKALPIIDSSRRDALRVKIQDAGRKLAKALTELGCQGCSGTCYFICNESCEGGCRGTCENTCLGGCESACPGTCYSVNI